jgi:5'-deoxynucleotidase YfbR-like HD superfamily hydrolase
MLALHDLPEIVVGDTPAYDAGARAVAVARERQAARELLAQLPEGPELDALYAEFVEEATDEARFANAVDRLQPILLHSACDGAAWRKRAQGRTKLDEFVAKITCRLSVRRKPKTADCRENLETANQPYD